MQTRTDVPARTLNPVPNPRGNQTLPQPKPALPRSPNGRFAPEFRPHPPQTRP
jgi:hypothetical protein